MYAGGGVLQARVGLLRTAISSPVSPQDVILYSWTHHVNRVRLRGATKDVTKVNYNPTNCLMHAASRDRIIYQWRWPVGGAEDGEESVNQSFSVTDSSQEPTQKLEGHTLGVTALASTNCEWSRANHKQCTKV